MIKDSSPKYHVMLMSQDFGDKVNTVVAAVKQTIPSLSRYPLVSMTPDQEHSPIYQWDYLTGRQASTLQDVFRVIGVKLEITEVSSTFLFPPEELDGFLNNWYSSAILKLEEDALADWAEATGVDEAYRFTLIPSFAKPSTIRVWEKGIARKGTGEVFGATPATVEIGRLAEFNWINLRHLLNEHNFWSSSSWYTVPGGGAYNDGTRLVFEGYKAGRFKFLYDHSPQQGSAHIMCGVFLTLRPANS